jgi:hypothetical protein
VLCFDKQIAYVWLHKNISAKYFEVHVIVVDLSDTTLITFCLLEVRPTYSFTTKKGSSSVMSALNDTHALPACCNIRTVHLVLESSGKFTYIKHKITNTTNTYKQTAVQAQYEFSPPTLLRHCHIITIRKSQSQLKLCHPHAQITKIVWIFWSVQYNQPTWYPTLQY